MTNIAMLADEHLSAAHESEHGRSAVLVTQDGPLRQTLIALRAGAVLGEHNAPPAASVLVLDGAVTITAESGTITVAEDQLEVLMHERHSVEAVEDSVFLLTVVTATPEG